MSLAAPRSMAIWAVAAQRQTAGPEAAAFDGTYVWVATQFNNTITRIRASDGAIAGTFAVGKRPVALLYAGWICLGG